MEKNYNDSNLFQINDTPTYQLWDELRCFFGKIDFSPWGTFSTEIPLFHRENTKKVAELAHVSDFQYAVPRGMDILIDSIIKNFAKIYYKPLSTEEVLTSSGAVKIAHALISTFIESPEDELVILEPYYPYYFTQNLSTSKVKKFRTVPMYLDSTSNSFKINFDVLEAAVNDKTRLLMLCNPNNPTSRVYTKEEYERITKIISRYPNLKVCEDCAYFPYLIGNRKLTYFASIGNNYERTITFFSCAKVFSVTGQRLGIAVGEKTNIDKLSETLFREMAFASPMEQMIFAYDLDSASQPYEGCENYWDYVSKKIEERHSHLRPILRKFNINLVDWEGTYYGILDVSYFRKYIPEKYYYKMDNPEEKTKNLDEAFCRMMLIEENLGLSPLSPTQNWNVYEDKLVRICMNRNDKDFQKVEAALQNICVKLKISLNE